MDGLFKTILESESITVLQYFIIIIAALIIAMGYDKVTAADDDFCQLLDDRYIEPIDDKTYILTQEADNAYLELVTLYRDRLTSY